MLVTNEDDLSFTSVKSQPERGNGRTYNLTKFKGNFPIIDRQRLAKRGVDLVAGALTTMKRQGRISTWTIQVKRRM